MNINKRISAIKEALEVISLVESGSKEGVPFGSKMKERQRMALCANDLRRLLSVHQALKKSIDEKQLKTDL